MSTDKSPYPTPDNTLILTIDGQARELFMSHGLKTLLSQKIGSVSNVEAIAMLQLDPAMQQDFLEEILQERTKTGLPLGDRKSLLAYDISSDDADRAINWVVDHLISFFIQRAMSLGEMQKKLAEAQQKTSLDPSTPGSKE